MISSNQPRIRRQIVTVSVLLGLVVSVAVLHRPGIAQPETTGPDVGFRGVLDELPPESLAYENFEKLGEDWEDWTAETGEALVELYGNPESTRAGQREQIAFLRGRVDDLQRGRLTAKTEESREAFISLAYHIGRRLDLMDRLLAVIPETDDPTETEDLREQFAELVNALETYEARNSTEAIASIREQLAELEETLGDRIAPLREFVRNRYLNFNLQFIATERLLTLFVNDTDQQSAPVRDRVFGASIYGQQTTNTQVAIDLQPGTNVVKSRMILTGVTNSNTVGVTEQATIVTAGVHRFWATKPITFDGRHLTTDVAVLSIDPENTTVGATTKYSKIPLFGPHATKIAIREARKRKYQGEARTAEKMKDQILPQFDKGVTDAIAKGNTALKNLTERLIENDLNPRVVHASSTDTALRYASLVRSDSEFGGDLAPPALPPAGGMTVQLHESLANNAVDRMNFGGRTLTQTELGEEIKAAVASLTGRPVEPTPPPTDEEAEEDTLYFTFEETDPVRVQFQEGRILLTLRTAFTVLDDEELDDNGEPKRTEVPPREVTIELVPKLTSEALTISVGQVEVTRVKGTPAALAQTRVITDRLNEAKERPPRVIENRFPVERDEQPTLILGMKSFTARNGWLAIDMQ